MSDLTFNQYDETAKKTAQYPEAHGLTYTAFGLSNEAGEVLGKLKKLIRDHDDFKTALEVARPDLIAELGDVLWYLSALSSELGTSLEEVARSNNAKLLDRLARGKIKGSGDKR